MLLSGGNLLLLVDIESVFPPSAKIFIVLNGEIDKSAR